MIKKASVYGRDVDKLFVLYSSGKKWLQENRIGRVRNTQSNISSLAKYQVGFSVYDLDLGEAEYRMLVFMI